MLSHPPSAFPHASESSDKAVSAVNRSAVVRVLLKCLDLAVYPSGVVVAVGK